ncbi:hypothetical protein Tco_0827098, partial [Tanacetum coccineum]
MNKRKKHFVKLRAEEKRRKPPTKAQKRNLMSTYLKTMGGYKYNQLKSKSYDEIQKLFDNEMKRVNTFIPIDSEVMKRKVGTEEILKEQKMNLNLISQRRQKVVKRKLKAAERNQLVRKEQKQEFSKRQIMEDDKETDEHEEAKEDDEAEMKNHMEVV